ncbi:MAG: hypothetical protein ACRDFB_09860 [Rhabdochlamydiaceae bacterium]
MVKTTGHNDVNNTVLQASAVTPSLNNEYAQVILAVIILEFFYGKNKMTISGHFFLSFFLCGF